MKSNDIMEAIEQLMADDAKISKPKSLGDAECRLRAVLAGNVSKLLDRYVDVSLEGAKVVTRCGLRELAIVMLGVISIIEGMRKDGY